MTQSLSRFQLVEGNPPHPPHKCAVCGSINGTFIDFQLDLEFYGTVYFCVENCFTDLANELGYRSPAQHHLTLEALALKTADLNDARDTIERLEDAVDALRYIGTRDSSSAGLLDSIPNFKRPADVPVPVEDKRDESEAPGSSAKSGLTDILDDDSFNEFN